MSINDGREAAKRLGEAGRLVRCAVVVGGRRVDGLRLAGDAM
jgi:hypothetical protein